MVLWFAALQALLLLPSLAHAGTPLIGAGNSHTCALTSEGGVKCWGVNWYGQLGDGSKTDRLTPVDVSGLTSGVSAVTAGGMHTCALTTGGGVKCWGNSGSGVLGHDTSLDPLIPGEVKNLASGIKAIAAGNNHTCALTSGGGVKCWGYNGYGQLGDGTKTDRWTAVDVVGLTSGVSAIAASTTHTCALTTAGGVKCWGYNDAGAIGDGSNTDRWTPTSVIGLTSGIVAIAAGGGHSCALTSGGAVKCWGWNYYGQLGNNNVPSTSATRPFPTSEQWVPVDVSGLTSGVSAIAAGSTHTCALTGSGGVKCWGRNTWGAVGDGSTSDRWTAVNVSGLGSGVSDLAAGLGERGTTCVRTVDGVLKCWGNNNYGQLGDGTLTQRLTAVDVVGMAKPVVTQNLVAGWNLLGNGSSAVLNVASAFGDSSKVISVWKWIAPTAKWAFYTPTATDSGAAHAASNGYDVLSTVAGGEGFWVNAKTPFTATLPTGTPIDSATFKSMASSWNLIATGDNKTPGTFNNALSTTTPTAGQIPNNFTALWTWDAALAKWYFYAPSLEQSGGLSNYVASNGYLDFGSKLLGPTSGFWVNKASGGTGTTLTQKTAPMTTALGGTLTLDNGAQLNAPPAAITSNGIVTFSQVNSAKGFGTADANHTVYELAGPIDPAKASFVFPGKAGLSAATISVVNYDTATGEGAAVPFSYDAASGRITVTPQPAVTAARFAASPGKTTAASGNGIMGRLGYLVEYESLYVPLGGHTIQSPFYEHLSPVTNPSGTSCWAAAATMLVKSFTLDSVQDTEMLSFLTYLHVSDDDYGSGIIGFSELLPRALSLYTQRSVEWRGYVNFTNLRSRLLREIDNGHPVILRWPGHVVLAVGYEHLGDGNYNIVMHDPKGVTPQNNDDGGMYSVRSWDWIRAKTWTGAIQLMWAQGEVQPARSLQTVGLPSGTAVGAVEFLGRNVERTPPGDEGVIGQYRWSMTDPFGHAWYRSQDKVAAVGLAPYTATQLRIRLPLWNASSAASTVQVRARIYDKNLATLYRSPVQSVSLGANQATPLIHEILIPVSNFRNLDKVDANNQIEFRIETEVQDATGAVYRDGWSENNMRGAMAVKPWITTVTPFSDARGNLVTVDGYSFGATKGTSLLVFFKDLPAEIISWSENRIIAKVPSGALKGNVVVQLGTSNGNIPSNGIEFSPALSSVSLSCNGLDVVIGASNGLRLTSASTPTVSGMSSTCDFTYESACTAGAKSALSATIDFSKGFVFEYCANGSCNYQGPNNAISLGWNGSSWATSAQYRCTGVGSYPTEPAQCLAPKTYTAQWDCASSSYLIYAQRETDAWIRVQIKKPPP
jgi:alpha-tubulin suppressor-like RCC1 family protein